jgi:hypothetical protein
MNVNTYARPTIFIEASPENGSNLYIESGGERAPMENGAMLQPPIKANTHLTFSVFGAEAEPLCTWTPSVIIRSNLPPPSRAASADGDPLDYLPIHRLGDPIVALATGNITLNDDFHIDGMAMPVLLQVGRMVYLRDPGRTPGLRTIQSLRHASPSLFVDVEIRPPRVEMVTRSLTISVTGLEELRRPIHLALFNSHRERLRLNCGRDNPFFDDIKPDGYENKILRITPGEVKKGRFETACSIRVVQTGQTGIWTSLAPEERGLHFGDGRRRF